MKKRLRARDGAGGNYNIFKVQGSSKWCDTFRVGFSERLSLALRNMILMFPIYLPFVSVWKNIEGTLSTDEGFLLKVSLITIQRKLLPRLSLKQPERLTSKPSRKIEKLFLREEKPENGFNYGKKNFPRTRKKKKTSKQSDGWWKRKIPTGW